MENKKCNKCLVIKPVSAFGKESRAKNGYKPRCKSCNNKDLYEWRSKNPSYMSDQMKVYYQKNKEAVKGRVKNYYRKNVEKKRLYNKKYREDNLDKINKNTLKYVKDKIKNDPDFNLTRLHRKLIYRLKIEKLGRSSEVLGYTKDELKDYLGRYPGKNECIDHKVPVSWFKDKSDVKIINSLSNLQILSRSENLKKGNLFSHEVSLDYYNLIINKIKEKYKQKLKWK